MKVSTKALVFSFLLSISFTSPVYAQESASWLQKFKNFFSKSSQTEQVKTTEEAKEETNGNVPEKKGPVFDFSEKTIGNREAPIKIHVFTSLTCPHCTQAHTQIVPYLKEKYVSNNEALIILHDFPLEQRAMTASLVSLCLTGHDYFAFIDTLFENQSTWAVAQDVQQALLPFAKLAGLSEENMIACATDEAATKEIIRQRNLAVMRYKIHATPSFIIQLGEETERFEGAPRRTDIDEKIERLKKTYAGPWPSAQKTEEQPAPAAP